MDSINIGLYRTGGTNGHLALVGIYKLLLVTVPTNGREVTTFCFMAFDLHATFSNVTFLARCK